MGGIVLTCFYCQFDSNPLTKYARDDIMKAVAPCNTTSFSHMRAKWSSRTSCAWPVEWKWSSCPSYSIYVLIFHLNTFFLQGTKHTQWYLQAFAFISSLVGKSKWYENILFKHRYKMTVKSTHRDIFKTPKLNSLLRSWKLATQIIPVSSSFKPDHCHVLCHVGLQRSFQRMCVCAGYK